MTDRNIGTASDPQSVFGNQRDPTTGFSGWLWTQRRFQSGWIGAVARNDNHASLESTHLHDTEYAGHAHTDDHLFEAVGDDDAYLIHSGN